MIILFHTNCFCIIGFLYRWRRISNRVFFFFSCQSVIFFGEHQDTLHVATSVWAGFKALCGKWGGRTRAGPGDSGHLRVTDLRTHIIRLPALQLLSNKPLHLFPVGVWFPSQTLILLDGHTFILVGTWIHAVIVRTFQIHTVLEGPLSFKIKFGATCGVFGNLAELLL